MQEKQHIKDFSFIGHCVTHWFLEGYQMLSLLQHSHATWNIIWSIFSDFLFNTKAFVLQAHDEQDKENEGRTGKVKYWIN